MIRRPRTPLGVMVVAVSATILVTLPSCLLGALGLAIRTDLGFSAAEVGLAVGGFFLASSLASLLSGRMALAERLGVRPLLFVGVLASALVMGFIAGFAQRWVDVAVALAVSGFLNGVVQPGVNLAIARRIPRERMGLALGVKQAAIPAATLLAGVAVAFLAVLTDWRLAWWIGATATVVFVVAALVVAPRESVRFAGGHRSGGPSRKGGLRMDASLLRVTVASILASMGANALRVFFVESAVSQGESFATAGLILSVASIVAIITRLLSGYRSDRVARHPYVTASALMFAGAAGYALMGVAQGVFALLAAAILGISAGWGWSSLVQLGAMHAHLEAASAATAYVHFGGLFGNLLGPIAFGLLLPLGYTLAWSVLAVVSAVGAGLMLLDVGLQRRST